MDVSVITMHEKIYEGKANEVILPGDDGELSVWDNHRPCLYALRVGRITIIHGANLKSSILIKRGIVHAEANRLTAMVEI